MMYPRQSAKAISCVVKVRYFRKVAAAILALCRLLRKTLVASAMVMRLGADAGSAGWGGLTLPSQEAASCQAVARTFASVQSAVPVCLRLKVPPRVPDT